MNDERDDLPPRDDGTESAEIDLGAPVDELLRLDAPARDGFLRGVRRRIYRRDLAANAVDLSFRSLPEVVWGYLSFLMESLSPKRKENPDG